MKLLKLIVLTTIVLSNSSVFAKKTSWSREHRAEILLTVVGGITWLLWPDSNEGTGTQQWNPVTRLNFSSSFNESSVYFTEQIEYKVLNYNDVNIYASMANHYEKPVDLGYSDNLKISDSFGMGLNYRIDENSNFKLNFNNSQVRGIGQYTLSFTINF